MKKRVLAGDISPVAMSFYLITTNECPKKYFYPQIFEYSNIFVTLWSGTSKRSMCNTIHIVYGHQDKHPVSTFSELQDWSCEGGSLFIKIGQLETYQHRSECNRVQLLKSNHKWENSVEWEKYQESNCLNHTWYLSQTEKILCHVETFLWTKCPL